MHDKKPPNKLLYNLIDNFRDFLNVSYENVKKINQIIDWDEIPNWQGDFQQTIFEVFVNKIIKSEFNIKLIPYGVSSYSFSANKISANDDYCRIVCHLDNSSYYFVSFTSKDADGFWCDCAPYDWVDVETFERELIRINYKLINEFSLEKINKFI
jgi:hypothetical protein